MAEMLGGDYNPRNLLEQIYLNPEAVLDSDELWLCAWCYRCESRCPQGLRLPEILLNFRSVARERGNTRPLDRALQKIVKNVPLPLVTTLVCFHPERAGLQSEKVLDKIDEIRGEWLKTKKGEKPEKSSYGKVAVIGSGPAGLTVAYELSRKGFHATVFESLPELGGMLTKCLPEFRLPRRVLTREIRFIKDLGVEIKTNTRIGKDVSFEDLQKEGYGAIFVGAGAHKSQELKVEGVELSGVFNALDFLWNSNLGKKLRVGKNVVVIGGGNVAIDAARMALRQKADATILYRRSREEMPANRWEVKEAESEGVKIEFLVSPKRFVGKEGSLTAVECVRMQLGEPDETGRKKAFPLEGSEFTRETDSAILAIGEAPDLSFLPGDIELNEDGTVWVNPITMETSVKGIFAGGDAVSGPASVIEAIRDGKRAAISIEDFLKSERKARL
jgi:NADPH-dependent glutamate synthase beta subunit-like oxidoreductase